MALLPGLPRVSLEVLLQPHVICSETWETTVEKLAVSLSRDRVCVLTVPTPHSAAYTATLRNLLKELQSHLPAAGGCTGGSGSTVAPGSKSLQLRAGFASSTLLHVTYGYLEATARAALQALCRSRLLRLRGDALSGVLDDLPLPRTQQGSSVLSLKAFVDNFQEAGQGAAAPIFPDPQEEAVDRGLLSVMVPQEAHDQQRGTLSVMQVKDASGKWRDVVLGPGEVALVLGHTMQHATAGILAPSTYRVAGDPYGRKKGQSRRLLHFELRPRPAAVLDLQQQLEDAGHQVASKYLAPVGVRSLMERFELLMSPGKNVQTPQNMEGVAVHTAWDQATCKKGRKRGSDAAELAEEAPVTRSGNVRRTSDGVIVSQHRPSRFKQQAATVVAAAGAPAGENGRQEAGDLSQDSAGGGTSAGAGGHRIGGSSQGRSQPSGSSRAVAEALQRQQPSLGGGPASGGGTGSTLYFVRGRTCTVLDGCLQDEPSECISLCVRSFTGIERWFYMNSSLACGRLFETYCDRMGIDLGAVKFLHKGARVFGADTPAGLQVGDGEEFTAVPESSDRLLQARELGPLYATLFNDGSAGGGSNSEPF